MQNISRILKLGDKLAANALTVQLTASGGALAICRPAL